MKKIIILDYGLGNVKSISNAFLKCGAKVLITNSKTEIENSSGMVLPGVGAFAYGMSKLKEENLDELIKEYAKQGKPILGICLGMQLLFDQSTEFGSYKGLSLISGKVVKLPKSNEKLPHVSWNKLNMRGNNSSKNDLLPDTNIRDVYFVHSYYAEPENPKIILSTTSYAGIEFCSSIKHNNIYGCQFHPEKSASYGLKIISNFKEICERNI